MSAPFGKRGHFFKIWNEQRDLWESFEIPAEMCPRITKQFLEEERRTNTWFEQEYHCKFMEAEDQYFSNYTIQKMFDADIKPLWGTA
jgi:hypothetical protein